MGIVSVDFATGADTAILVPIYTCAVLYIITAGVATTFSYQPMGKRSRWLVKIYTAGAEHEGRLAFNRDSEDPGRSAKRSLPTKTKKPDSSIKQTLEQLKQDSELIWPTLALARVRS
jgi:hypothetical protein